jgi:hypothetical protein
MMKAFVLFVFAAALGLAQGAISPRSSFYSSPTYPDVTHVGTGTGWLQFDAKNEMRFVAKKGEEFRIPYKAIKNLQYEKATEPPAERASAKPKSRWSVPVKMNFAPKHQVTIRYESATGPETATLWLDRSNYQNVLGTLTAKTGLAVERTGISSWE